MGRKHMKKTYAREAIYNKTKKRWETFYINEKGEIKRDKKSTYKYKKDIINEYKSKTRTKSGKLRVNIKTKKESAGIVESVENREKYQNRIIKIFNKNIIDITDIDIAQLQNARDYIYTDKIDRLLTDIEKEKNRLENKQRKKDGKKEKKLKTKKDKYIETLDAFILSGGSGQVYNPLRAERDKKISVLKRKALKLEITTDIGDHRLTQTYDTAELKKVEKSGNLMEYIIKENLKNSGLDFNPSIYTIKFKIRGRK